MIHKYQTFVAAPEEATIDSIVTNESNTIVTVDFTDFSSYTGTLYNGDCYNDSEAAFELYNADTDNVVTARNGYSYCFSLWGTPTLIFEPVSLDAGNYFIHYHGYGGREWVSDEFEYSL